MARAKAGTGSKSTGYGIKRKVTPKKDEAYRYVAIDKEGVNRTFIKYKGDSGKGFSKQIVTQPPGRPLSTTAPKRKSNAFKPKKNRTK